MNSFTDYVVRKAIKKARELGFDNVCLDIQEEDVVCAMRGSSLRSLGASLLAAGFRVGVSGMNAQIEWVQVLDIDNMGSACSVNTLTFERATEISNRLAGGNIIEGNFRVERPEDPTLAQAIRYHKRPKQ